MAPMSDTNRPACLFCNQTTASTSDEHVLPHSWKKTFPSGDGGQVQIGRDRNGRDRTPKEKKQVSPYDLKVKRVCSDCNGGWMREMDETAKDMIFDLSHDDFEEIIPDATSVSMIERSGCVSRSVSPHRREHSSAKGTAPAFVDSGS